MNDSFSIFMQNVEKIFINENINMISSNYNLIIDDENQNINENEIQFEKMTIKSKNEIFFYRMWFSFRKRNWQQCKTTITIFFKIFIFSFYDIIWRIFQTTTTTITIRFLYHSQFAFFHLFRISRYIIFRSNDYFRKHHFSKKWCKLKNRNEYRR